MSWAPRTSRKGKHPPTSSTNISDTRLLPWYVFLAGVAPNKGTKTWFSSAWEEVGSWQWWQLCHIPNFTFPETKPRKCPSSLSWGHTSPGWGPVCAHPCCRVDGAVCPRSLLNLLSVHSGSPKRIFSPHDLITQLSLQVYLPERSSYTDGSRF